MYDNCHLCCFRVNFESEMCLWNASNAYKVWCEALLFQSEKKKKMEKHMYKYLWKSTTHRLRKSETWNQMYFFFAVYEKVLARCWIYI